jgi:hypothetical protein
MFISSVCIIVYMPGNNGSSVIVIKLSSKYRFRIITLYHILQVAFDLTEAAFFLEDLPPHTVSTSSVN